MNELVSVIIPTYNRADFLPQTIQSILNQTYQDWELIVVDDGSKDITEDIVDGFKAKDRKIEYFYQVNKGAGAARNSGIRKSSGNYIAFLDSDDEWLPEKLERQVDFMRNNPEYDFCYTADKVVSSDNQVRIKRYRNIADLSSIKLAGIGIGVPSSHLYKRDVFERRWVV
ncbi:MAG: glycosyltransferase family 2 protein [Nitrospirae bacterium]|nr:glycosyltransferase family 2 protein [Nitrospirota bacterium]